MSVGRVKRDGLRETNLQHGICDEVAHSHLDMKSLWRFTLSHLLITSTVRCSWVHDEYCLDPKPDCAASPVCQEIAGDKVFREWACLGEVESQPLRDHSKIQRKFEIDVRLGLAGRNPPVLLVMDGQGKYKLSEPTRRSRYSVYMNLEGKRILLACPGKGNTLQVPGVTEKQTAEASSTFTNGTTYFEIAGKLYEPDGIKCSRRVSPYEYMTGAACNGDGVLLNLGYFIDNKMIELLRTCHRLADGLTYYSRHILDGSHFPLRGSGGKRKDEARRPKFSYYNRALFRNFPPQNYYTQKTQIQSISGMIDDGITIGKGDQFFARGHLTPNGDFVMATWRDVTFSYVNVQPQWQQINGGNWNRVEIEIRYNAAKTARKYEVITGVAGHLRPKGNNIYLDTFHQRLPVPNRFTKLVREIETNKCIAFIVNNFPKESDPECRDVCSSYDWLKLQQPEEEGYVYCCTYMEFAQAFPKAAPKVNCQGGVLHDKNHQ